MPPNELLSALAQLRRRVRLLGLVYGVGLLVASAVALLLGTIALDYLLDLPSVPRFIVVLASVGTLGWIIARYIIRPVWARLELSELAGRVETAYPVFDDRLRSTVAFLSGNAAGSAAMRARVIEQTTALAKDVQFKRVARLSPAFSSLGGGVLAVAICFGLATIVSPAYLHAAIARLLLPFGNAVWPHRTQIALTSAVPGSVPVGDRVEVRIRLTKGDKPTARALVEYRYGDGPLQQELMTRGADGQYSADLDAKTLEGAATNDMHVRVICDDDRRLLPPIRVVPRLTIRAVSAVITPPAYADLPPQTLDLTAAAGTAAVGSKVSLQATFNKPLAAGQSVELESVEPAAMLPPLHWATSSDGVSAACSFLAQNNLHFRLKATDIDGFSNSAIEEYQLLVRPDRAPTVQFEQPVQNLDCTPVAVVPIQAIAEDDFGIKTLQLCVDRLGDTRHWQIDLISQGKPVSSAVGWNVLDATPEVRRFEMNWAWNLADLAKLDPTPLKAGDQLDFYLRVQDNFLDAQGQPHQPPFSTSGHFRLSVISQEALTTQITDRLAELREQTGVVRQSNEAVRISTKNLQTDTRTKPAFDKSDRALAGQLANDQSTAASGAEQVAQALDDLNKRLAENRSPNSELANNVSQARELVTQAAQGSMKDAAGHLGDARDQPSPPNPSPAEQKQDQADRNAALDQVQNLQQSASTKLQQAMDKMGSATGVSEFLQRVNDLLTAQQHLAEKTQQIGKSLLGKDPSQLTPDEMKALEGLAKEQTELQKQVDQATKDMNDASQKQSKSDPASSQALKQAADTAQQQNISGNMGQAAQAQQQNQQASAQSSQQQAELGLMMIMRQLKEAQNRRLSELLKKLDDAQQLIADLIEQQASHNLDNLSAQGAGALKAATKADVQLIAALCNYAGRDPQHLPPAPALATLVALQEQTEHNARNIVPVIQALPEGADPAADITRAAQEMSRAITQLQDNHLADAYQPPQVEAINALLSAKQSVDQQIAKNKQKLQDQQKESIRRQFVQIREDQKKLNDETIAVDKSPRNEQGELTHGVRAKLGLLSDQQADLGKRAAKLDDDLAAVGSIAYTYANDQIVAQMQAISGQLEQLASGAPTQVKQARVLRELDEMIQELAIKPKQSLFNAPRSGGSGGGGSAPKLPPEAELRLLQDLQRNLNEDTKAADAAKPHNADDVADLGKREGDLRGLLDQVLNKASHGKLTLGPEPSNKETLPEEAKDDDLDLEELKDAALNAKPQEQGEKDDTGMVGIRMARARQRLALNNDPGLTTQRIQDRILINLEALANMARQEQANNPSSGGGGKGMDLPVQMKRGNPSNSVAQGQRSQGPKAGQSGSTPAQDSSNGGPGLGDTDITAKIDVLKDTWGRLSPRQRAAVMEGATEKTLTQFKSYVDGYYRTLAVKASQQ